MSKLTDQQLKYNRMLHLGNILTFEWNFTGAQAFGGILRKSRSSSATKPIFPFNYELEGAHFKENIPLSGLANKSCLASHSPSTKVWFTKFCHRFVVSPLRHEMN